MYVVESKGGAIACMLCALLFLGTWPAILALLERRGRLPQHTYLDYSLTNLLAAVLIAFTVGQTGESKPSMPNFTTQLFQDNWHCILFAMAGGVFLSLGYLGTQYAFAFVGLSVTEFITSSTAVVLGTTLNYFLDNRINSAEILFPRVACFLIAVCLGYNAADNEKKLQGLQINNKVEARESEKPSYIETMSYQGWTKQVGLANYLIEYEETRAIKSIWLGLSIARVSYSLFSPAFNSATNDQWHVMRKGVPHLVVYTAFFYFSLSFFIMAVILNVIFLYRSFSTWLNPL